MFIKSIVLDGFKSYGNRVEITGFDPQFNAITGLNGTGKSNILDSICFVLGITNLSNVRAGSLQELIYKHGQAGITKATVSITFDNRDKKQCPIGYENHDEITVTRQVVMGGKNKYLINGINVQNKRVSDLFCSVQLNVNNPHFLIMQGRITKVLNMKPPEILSMIEEAAGTRMYEAKKQAAQKTIEKKDAKLRELNDIIKEDIAPKLQKLQDERSQFQEYQKVVRELENLTKLHVAWKYVKAEEKALECESKVSSVQQEIKDKKDEIKNNVKESKEMDKKIMEVNKKLDEESGAALASVQAQLEQAEANEASARAALSAANDACTLHTNKRKLLQQALADDQQALKVKLEQQQQAQSASANMQAAGGASGARLAAAQQRVLALSSGQETDDGALHVQLIAAKKEAADASTRISQNELERRHAEKRLRTLKDDFKSGKERFDRDQATIRESKRQLEIIQGEVQTAQQCSGELAQCEGTVRALRSRLSQARDSKDALAARLQRCDFRYTPPDHHFNPASVYGPLCRLMDVIDPKYCVALETAAGGRLYNVVVDTETTSKALLQRGKLQTRTTIVPLNKISGYAIDERTLAVARNVGGGADCVWSALELVRADRAVIAALRWALGGTLVCGELRCARAVCFHPEVRRRAVTLQGDAVDPAGTLQGGAAQKGGSILLQIRELKELEKTVAETEAELARETERLHDLRQKNERFLALQQKQEAMTHELEMVQSRLLSAPHAQLHAEITSLEQRIAELTSQIEKDQVTLKEATAKAKDLEAKVKDIKGYREREYKKAEEELAQAKLEAERHGHEWAQRAQQLETLALEVTELQQAVTSAQQQLEQLHSTSDQLVEDQKEKKSQLAARQEEVKELQSRIKRQKTEIASRSSEIGRMNQQKEKFDSKNKELELQIKELEFAIGRHKQETEESRQTTAALEKEYTWISEERQFFGKAGGVYDFEGRQAYSAGQRRAALTQRREKLARGLNTRAHALLGKEEEQYQELVRKKRIVEADRAKLVQVMEELDEKKRRTLVTACEQVNRDFGNIFSTLLPGAHAQLQPPPGASVLDGLEVKVGFRGTWKESLAELSGGQRSLVALALVLAMLLFKPAPLYILDEVDAALDLSHTQNIGIMLKEHFKHSQFIIVSLKDGMFNNANVLFRTKFIDGMSSVQRTVNTRR